MLKVVENPRAVKNDEGDAELAEAIEECQRASEKVSLIMRRMYHHGVWKRRLMHQIRLGRFLVEWVKTQGLLLELIRDESGGGQDG